MSRSDAGGGPPKAVRIELATSEIEGGRCRGWADPSQVLTVVAVSEPEDAFVRCVEPHLTDTIERDRLNEDSAAGEAGPRAGGFPPALQKLIQRLKEIHKRLYRENQSLMRDPRWVSMTCALAEEDRVYFVKGAPSWVYLLRNGKAYPAESEGGEGERQDAALGRQESLKLEVTSLPVKPGDTVVLLTAETDVPPDLRALVNMFGQTQDLKRACDGLVNLLGLQSEGAGAVALRFLPIGGGDLAWENPLEGLAEEMQAPVAVDEPTDEVLDDLLGEFGTGPAQMAGEEPEAEKPEAEPVQAEAPAGSDQETAAGPDQEAAADKAAVSLDAEAGGTKPQPDSAPEPVGAGAGAGPASVRVSTRRGRGVFWPVLISLVAVGLVLLAAVPIREGSDGLGVQAVDWIKNQDFGSWIPGRGDVQGEAGAKTVRGGGFGVLEVAPDPPARSVLLNGEVRASGTPVRLEGIPAGRHRLGLDLGPCGVWETELHISKGETATLAPRLTGSVEVVAADPSANGSVWAPGREKLSTPARIDSLPVGWNRIFYEDDRLPMWDRSVLVRTGEAARVVVPNDFSSDQGLVRIGALVFRQGEGLVESAGDSVWVDGVFAGRTPLEKTMAPGLHSIRIGAAGRGRYSEVLEVRAGTTRHVQGQLETKSKPAIIHTAPGKVWVRGPVLLSAEIRGAQTPVRPTLHLPELPPGSREIPMTPVDQGRGVYVGVVSPETLPLGAEVSYYFTIQGPNGETIWSDLYRMRCAEDSGENPDG